MGQFMTEVFARADAFLLGRRTYEIFAVYWPHITDPNDRITQALNTLPKHVASKTLNGVTWDRSRPLRDVVGEVQTLKQEYGREIQVHGSGGLAQTLIQHGLVDEYHLLWFPLCLGPEGGCLSREPFRPRSNASPRARRVRASTRTARQVVRSTVHSRLMTRRRIHDEREPERHEQDVADV